MSLVLLDTNVVSELVRPKPEPRVIAFLQRHSDALLSVLTLHELRYGAERARDPSFRDKLTAWVETIRVQFGDRIVEVNAEVAEYAGAVRATRELKGLIIDPLDALIAASALLRGAAVATRNVKDFEAFGVAVTNPWAA